ncbi:Por secretion system C-terminal sorting domain-containing protein [Catalinimonas alkaloidigena]|uniref:Por secretion system C-terminal sorting domain-containing protein n=1 Tax=Catalinimonas alkaloidigena TaxID=1075417 RepID=A0A1G9R4H7_9BACT|nr:T9SS type A sorting domain-containing protein [Catalinimonas alkaloidigena]SDM18144.1 Por secretion system C-terminal sorting domain-containing protein [Catalinimonas alkaloidigena]
MKKSLLFYCVWLFSLGTAYAQTPLPTAALDLTLQSTYSAQTIRSGVAYNPDQKLYYSVTPNSSNYLIETFNAAGVSKAKVSAGFDYAGVWWNPNTRQLEGNGSFFGGIWVQNLDANAYPLSSGRNDIPNTMGPYFFSSAQYDWMADEIIHYYEGNIYRYKRATHEPVGTVSVTGLPVPTEDVHNAFIAYTGLPGYEIGLYNEQEKVLYYVNKATGAYAGSSQLPVNTPSVSLFNLGFANGRLWVFDDATLRWNGYKVMCTATSGEITATACERYTSPSGKHTWTESGTYQDQLTNAAGCDSLLTIRLTIKKPTAATFTEVACSRYVWRGKTYTQSGTYRDTIPNAAGCDSVMTLNLTITQPTASTTTIAACGAYDWMGTTYTESGTYQTTIPNRAGCDSLMTLKLTIHQPTASTLAMTACGAYAWRGKTYEESGTYRDTIPNAAGCDSVLTLNLTITQPTAATFQATACEQYEWQGQVYTSGGTYRDTIPNGAGCDSIMTLELTLLQPTASTTQITSCTRYEWQGTAYTESGTYQATIPNAAGCDSVMTLELTMNQPTTSAATVTTCEAYEWRGTTYEASGTYRDTIPNIAGCDSVMTLTLTITQPTASTATIAACGAYDWMGTTYTESGTYQTAIPNAAGCDSAMTLKLTVTTVDTSVTVEGGTLTSNAANATYQWVDVAQNYLPIEGATAQQFTPEASGTYAVIVTQGECSDTSSHLSVVVTGVADRLLATHCKAYPNPTAGDVTLSLGQTYRQVEVRVRNTMGQIVAVMRADATAEVQVPLPGAAGLYIVEVQANEQRTQLKVVKR